MSTVIATETDRNHSDYPQFTRFPNQATSRAWYEVENDEALVITVPDVPCHFRNIQLANPWMEAGGLMGTSALRALATAGEHG